MGNLFESANTIQEKRAILKSLSKPLQELAKCDAIDSVNDGLKSLYRQEGHTTLKTMRQWNGEGKRVKKGERALCLWGRPKQTIQEKNNTETSQSDDDQSLNFYPICFVFSNLQIQ